jgi:hypothetical protein
MTRRERLAGDALAASQRTPIPFSLAKQIDRLSTIKDPIERGRASGRLLAHLVDATQAVSDVRETAVRDLAKAGFAQRV